MLNGRVEMLKLEDKLELLDFQMKLMNMGYEVEWKSIIAVIVVFDVKGDDLYMGLLRAISECRLAIMIDVGMKREESVELMLLDLEGYCMVYESVRKRFWAKVEGMRDIMIDYLRLKEFTGRCWI